MNSKVKISVVVPTFNRANYICDAVDSVLAQTYPVHEIIIIDDGSTDNTANVIKKYGKKIKYLKQKNKGPSAARNLGIKKSTGDFIAFLDSDDLWDKDKIKEQIDFYAKINDPDIGMIDTFSKIIDFEGKTLCKLNAVKQKNVFRELILRNIINQTSSVLVKRNVFRQVGVFNEKMGGVEDRELWIRIANRFNVYTVDKYLVTIRKHNRNISDDFEFMQKNTEKLLKIIFQRYKHKSLKRNKILAYNYAYYLPFYFKSFRMREFRKLFYRCVSLYPLILIKYKKRYMLHFIISFFDEKIIRFVYKIMGKDIR